MSEYEDTGPYSQKLSIAMNQTLNWWQHKTSLGVDSDVEVSRSYFLSIFKE